MKGKTEHLPIGAGGKKLREAGETLPAIEVLNEVQWINPAFEGNLPFPLELERPTKLGLFLTPDIGPASAMRMETAVHHGRSAVLGRVIFKDREGRLYRDVDIKGVGHVGSTNLGDYASEELGKTEVRPVEPRRTSGDAGNPVEAEGIFNIDDARFSRDMEERFLEMGVRTIRTIAIIELKEIVDGNGLRISIDRAKKDGFISEDNSPALAIRAWGTKQRVRDVLSETTNVGLESSYIEDAKKLVASEFGFKPEEFDTKKYLEWFAKTLGENVARIHKNGFVHEYLTPHNITLDCRIVDLDSVEEIQEAEKSAVAQGIKTPLLTPYGRDNIDVSTTLEAFVKHCRTANELNESTEKLLGRLMKIYYEAYEAETKK